MLAHTLALGVLAAGPAVAPPEPAMAERFARLALACVGKEYPNKIAHVLNGDEDVKPPRELTPAFFGCYDWHSAVHGHWLLARLARTMPDAPFAAEARAAGLESRMRELYAADRDCPLAYEPSGEDFLSPCLAEADLMRRILPSADYAAWLTTFLPGLPRDGSPGWLAPAVVTDPTDPKLAHLDGLNLSRAWMLEGIAAGLPAGDARLPSLRATAAAHREAGLRAVTGQHYEGGHWLGTFAVYLVTGRGLPAPTR